MYISRLNQDNLEKRYFLLLLLDGKDYSFIKKNCKLNMNIMIMKNYSNLARQSYDK